MKSCIVYLSCALSVRAAVLGERISDPVGRDQNIPIRNANHIYNAIRGAMRQWDNSWNHNGMSFFVATVPEGVQLYHGTSQADPITGVEWLAFEPEHALMFARPRIRGPPGGRGPDQGLRSPPNDQHEDAFSGGHRDQPRFDPQSNSPASPPHHDRGEYRDSQGINAQQDLLGDEIVKYAPSELQSNGSGYLHFYRSSHDLRLVYIDGLSAGKTTKGTLDSQDYVLGLNKHNATNSPTRERERANALCDLARNAWSCHVDGFIRMESGFEIILCDFEAGLNFDRAQKVHTQRNRKHPGPDSNSFRLYQAVADRFHGIGGGRVVVDYATLVSAFDFDFGTDLFVEDKTIPGQMLPRLDNQSEEDLIQLQKKMVDIIAHAARGETDPTIDWQAIAEMFVQRYAGPLKHLADPERSEKEMKIELHTLLEPFVSDNSMNTRIVIERCVEQFLPAIWPTTLAGRVVQQVASELCSTLVDTLHGLEAMCSEDENAYLASRQAKEAILKLTAYLDWPVWRECSPSCRFNEACVLPIWPITGSVADRKSPTCKNMTTFNAGLTRPRGGNDSYYWRKEEERHSPAHLPL